MVATEIAKINMELNEPITTYIGFTNVYYTLWSVIKGRIYSAHGGSYEDKTDYYFIQNLSKDLDKAKAKVEQSKGKGSFIVDLELRGTKSFYRTEKRVIIDKGSDTVVEFGKYSGRTLAYIASFDFKYFLWLSSEANDDLMQIVNNTVEMKTYLAEKEIEIQAILDKMKPLPKETEFELLFERNLKIAGEWYSEDDSYEQFRVTHAYYQFKMADGLTVILEFKDYASYTYGYDDDAIQYALPTIKGKGKRIKNKTLNVVLKQRGDIEIGKDDYTSEPAKRQYFTVQKFEIL